MDFGVMSGQVFEKVDFDQGWQIQGKRFSTSQIK
jgi:hypothetical protein